MDHITLLLGGNIGDTAARFTRAEALLEQRVGRIVRRSSRYRSEAWGFHAEEQFLNEAIEIECEIEPLELLKITQGIEKELGRDTLQEGVKREASGERYSSRMIDIDIILWGARVIKSPQLTIPHKEMAARRFVLEPLAEIIPATIHPEIGITIAELLKKV